MTALLNSYTNGTKDLECQELSSFASGILRATRPNKIDVPVTNVRHKDNKVLCDIDTGKLKIADKLAYGLA